jgi:hypothetical protein
MHAFVGSQSVLTTHSGRQFGGDPIKFCRHEQAGWCPIARQSELGPQGEGTHGLAGFGAGSGGEGGGAW